MTDNTDEQDPNAQADAWQQIKFTGTGLEFFKIWIVNLLLTLVTLGIYSAWATVRSRRYFYGNTHVAGSRFDFHGTGLQVLVGRVIALVLLLGWSQGHFIHPYLPIVCIAIVIGLFPWFMVRALRFRMRNTSLHNLRFNFSGTSLQAYKILSGYLLVLLVITLIPYFLLTDYVNNPGQQPDPDAMGDILWASLFPLLVYLFIYPAFVCDARKFMVNQSTFGERYFHVNMDRKQFVGAFLKAVVLAGFFVMIAFFVFLSVAEASTESFFVVGVVMVMVFVLASVVPQAYWQAFVFNQTLGYLLLGGEVEFKGHLVTKSLLWLLLTNTFMVLFSLGFAYPWAAVRLAKYQLEAISYRGGFDSFEGVSKADTNALGEEVGSAFDVEFGF